MNQKDLSQRAIRNETRRLKRKKASHCIDWRNDEKTMCGLELKDLTPFNNFFYHAFFDTLTHDICTRCRALLDKRREDERKEFLTIQKARAIQKVESSAITTRINKRSTRI